MAAASVLSLRSPVWHLCHLLVVSLGLALLWAGCSTSDNQTLTAPTAASPQGEQQAITNLLDLYRQALLQEDIDRLQALLVESPAIQPSTLRQNAATRQEEGSTFLDAGAFRTAMSTAFRTLTLTGFELPAETVQVAADRRSVTFVEIEHTEDPATLVQQTRLWQTTWQLTPDQVPGVTTFRIGAVRREGPVVQITTRGQVRAGALTRVEVTGTGASFPLTGVEVEVPETGVVQTLVATAGRWHGLFTPPMVSSPQPLRVRLRGPQREAMVLSHRYRLRLPGQSVVERIPGTGSTRLFAVAVAPDGTVWTGGDGGGRLYRVPPRARRAVSVGQLLTEPAGRVEDLVVDQLGRLHAIIVASQTAGDIVVDQGRFCQTVNVFDPAYPFRVRDLQTGRVQPSASTRALAAEDGAIWLFGSDGGVARVTDTFRDGQCPESGITVRYEPIFRRDAGRLLSNTVPAVAVGGDGTLWFGTAFGLTRFKDGQFTPLPFDMTLSFRGDVATLEAFFRDVAQALFNAQPLTSVGLGTVSFVAAFGQPLVKEDLIFSAVVDRQNRLWAGTLGGGLRRIEGEQETLHLTQREGLSSNLILSLAAGPEDTIWAATDDGVIRLQDRSGTMTITTFTALDGLKLPVRDVAVDGTGMVWIATDGGLFRIGESGGVIQGVVQDTAGRPVAGAEVIVVETPFRVVTDTEGRFTLDNVPPGTYQLQIDGSLATGGPFTGTSVRVVATGRGQTLNKVVLSTGRSGARLIEVSGNRQRGEPGAVLPEPLVVRLEDQFGNPLGGQQITATIIEGEGEFVSGQDSPVGVGTTLIAETDAQGEARFLLRVGAGEVNLVRTRISAFDQDVDFLTLVGFVGPQGVAVEIDGHFVVVDSFHKAVLRVDPDNGFRSLVSGRAQGSGPAFLSPWSIAVEANGTLVVVDNALKAVLRVDPHSGDRTVVSGCTQVDAEGSCIGGLIGRGPPLVFPWGIAVEANGTLVVVDNALKAVVRVDPRSGDRTLVSGCVNTDCLHTIGRGPLLVHPQGIAVEANGHFVVVDIFLAAVVRVDLATGDRSIASGCINIGNCTDTIGRGPALLSPWGIAVEMDGALVVVDAFANAVVRVEPRSGDRTLVSDASTGSGLPWGGPVGVAVEADGHLVVVDDALDAVVRIDQVKGDRIVVSRASTGGGLALGSPVGIAVEADGHFVVADSLLAAVVRVDPRSGDRTLVSGCIDADCTNTTGSGPPLSSPVGIAVEASGALVVVDSALSAIMRLDPRSGDRTLVSGCKNTECTDTLGSGLNFKSPRSIAVERDGHLVVVDDRLIAVVRVDPTTGDRFLVSGQGRGGGPSFFDPGGIAVESNGALVVINSSIVGVLRIDPISGDRTLVSETDMVSGPLFAFPEGITVQANGDVLVVDGALRAVVRVDPATGDRTIVSGVNTGSGPLFVAPRDIAVEPDGHLVVIDSLLPAVVRVDPATGDRTIISRLGVIPAAARAAAGNPRRRPLADVLAAQGTFCIDNGMGGCLLFTPPVPNYGLGFSAPAQNRCTLVDYAGVANTWVEGESGGRVSFRTEIGGLVIERPLVNGRAKVTVLLSTKNALTWVIEGCEVFATNPLLFGHRAPEVLSQGKIPALGNSFLLLEFINTAPGAALPDFIQLVFSPERGQEVNLLSLRVQADGTLREAFGVPDGTPGQATVNQFSVSFGRFFAAGFPVERIDLRVLGR